ncbi:MAG TPA: efflux RND transporter periplasmic adaptor subunit [Rhizomicrobium sp.]|nr:efflux RND transporter periplasmic adaptor subunit [Rhizomicrobium sp.]
MLPPEKKRVVSLASAAGPGHLPRARTLIAGGAMLALVLGGYWYFNGASDGGADKRANAAPVRVAIVERRDMPVVERSLGSVVANTLVQLSARVQGTLESANFKEGQFVRRGDLLFQIDPRPFEAALAQAQAIYTRDQAQLRNALRDKQRYAALRAQGAISVQQSDTSDTNADVMAANVAADKAALDMAQLNVEYTRIRSPVDGKTGPIMIQPGNMISTSNGVTAPLVTIAEIRPVKISFTLPQSELPRIQARQQVRPLLATLDARDSAGNPLSAPVDFVSNVVSNQSGSIELRATFPNTDLSLVPGQLVNVTVQLNDIPGALVVPRDAVNDSPSGSFVFAVRGGKAVDVPVRVLTDDGTDAAIVGDGLSPGDMVVAEGQLRVTPGGALRILGKPVGARGVEKSARPKAHAHT